jgi:uncharacterized protein (TIGR00255 family)
MTGFGRSECLLKDYQFVVDIKSLNGKQLDINARLPIAIRPFEINIKQHLQAQLLRGSVDVTIYLQKNGSSKALQLNTELAQFYYNSIMQLSKELNEPIHNPINTVLTMPEVISQSADEFNEADWQIMAECITKASQQLMHNRLQEGNTLMQHVTQIINNIHQAVPLIEPFEKERITKQRQKFEAQLQESSTGINYDKNRLEQELIYYLEKLDISEEKIRLAHHCDYFIATLQSNNEIQKGKMLGFILQEIGREINTLGSKAYDANIQKIVVGMKDELEKAKEQILNVL